jgi:hypothetical protein
VLAGLLVEGSTTVLLLLAIVAKLSMS